MALYNPASVTVTPSTASTSTPSTVNSSATSVTILALNSNRKGATIWNNSTADLYIDFDSTASTSDFAVKLSAGGYFELPFDYTGVISGIWSTANGSALVRELT
ncbi:hypothetical protein H6G41_08895 [Tolypothrix sp. FACHB-123]|uniref:hypothetical protein n=1 Tax=Tolypothrix sp. FACHB-123 TaxID=2692868 RepID=UPI001688F1FE|nr:hypothetical protein [Tolypothrix sp. FACHB-123]MBD2354744.1 hypothetical protein [Tolypothrix sp. FACHB-123]